MNAVIVSSSYSYLERVELLEEFYRKQGYETKILLTDFIHTSKTYADWVREGYIFVKTAPYKKNISVQRLYSHHKFAKDVATQLEKMDVDILHVMLPANSLAVTARKYKETHPNTKLYFDIVDLWPETMPINKFKNSYPFKKWKQLRDKNLCNADKVYCECNLFTKVLDKEQDTRFQTLYWVKTSKPVESNPKIDHNELHLCYLGSINNVIDIDYIVRMCQELSVHKKVVLHIIGDGEKREELLQKTKETQADVIYHGLVYEPEKKQAIFDQCHFGLNIMKQSVCVGLTMKSLDYFQAGLPIVNNIDGDTEDMINAMEIGYNGYHALLKKIDSLQTEDYLAMRDNVKKLYNEKFTKEAFMKRLEEND